MKQRIYFYGGLLLLFTLIFIFIRNPVFNSSRKSTTNLNSASPGNLREIVKFLSELNPSRNFDHPQSLNKASEYIAKNFRDSGLISRQQEYKVGDETYRNVIVDIGPDTGDYLIIGAHYDVCNEFPGADDNASGVAGLLEVARLLVPIKDKLPRPIELVAYTLEEPPNFGSQQMGSFVHAQSMKSNHKNIKLMISLEMIGYFKEELWSQRYPMPFFYLFYPSVGDYIALVGRPQEWAILREAKSLFLAATDLPVRSANVPRSVAGVDFSDQLNYWDLGFPAMMITDTAFMRNANYHHREDLPETLDYRRMAEVVDGVAGIAAGL